MIPERVCMQMFHQHTRELTWGDLISPRAMAQFTLGDAWGSLPTTLAMAGFFIGGVVLLWLIKRFLSWVLLHREFQRRWVLVKTKIESGKKVGEWQQEPIHSYGTIVHVILETLFFFGIGVAGLFAASVGNVNIWATAIGSVGIGIIGTYVFGGGLQQVGSGYFVLLTSMITVGEYWEISGQKGIEGRVTRICATYIELECADEEDQTCRLVRIPMTVVLGGCMSRLYHKEVYAGEVAVSDKKDLIDPVRGGTSFQRRYMV